MIFGQLFKRIKKPKADQQDTAAEGVQPQPQQKQDADSDRMTGKTVKKSKVQKKNKALSKGGEKKKRNRTVHTHKSFHPKKSREGRELVNIYDVIERPVVTEKAANQSERGVYTFIVQEGANKHTVADAVETRYGVRPRKVRIAKQPAKRKRLRIRGRENEYGMTAQKKKAYIFLKEGDTIQLT